MDVLEHFRERKDFASKRLAKLGDTRELCFAVSGLIIECSHYDFPKIAVLRRVESPPGEIELAKALTHKSQLSAVARHMPSVTHELAIVCQGKVFDQPNMNLGWWILSALRTRSQVNILVPAVANVSWDVIPAIDADACTVQLLEDVPSARIMDVQAVLTVQALDWVSAQLKNWINLLEQPAFRLAVDAMTTHHHHANLRMSAAALW